MKKYKTREEWLQAAVLLVNDMIFDGKMELSDYQVTCGWCKNSKAMGETLLASSENEEVSEHFYPTAIQIDTKIEDPVDIVAVLAHEMIHAFKNIRTHGKAFKVWAFKAGFETPVKEYHPTTQLLEVCKEIVIKLGEWPGIAIIPFKKNKKRKPQRGKLFCPDCGFECRAKFQNLIKYGFPTCACGTQLGEDLREFEEEVEKIDE